MRKFKVIARNEIRNPLTKKMLSDDDLRVLNGYCEDIVICKDNDKIEGILSFFEKKHPETVGWNFELLKMK